MKNPKIKKNNKTLPPELIVHKDLEQEAEKDMFLCLLAEIIAKSIVSGKFL